ncbi:hypothetical protein G7K_6833-t1 [Saitoella complicata NRRL Y-17804]|uniref:Pyrimidine 5'-nucleotidase n=2 Tax=Saitoella complicata (strain BCRC 22490 / CBS 7301 / JCM 7358 / NBRC 10748 / NRRL Y-17804) TaxID=698492 RepID=A0A0E9NTM7_SAICN|nr:hypothetical protein G7K_6833-t1 [Saitoella complicata NRRL Y-17804]
MTTTTTNGVNGHSSPCNGQGDDRITFFFDLDNCLYPKSHRIHDLMGQKIHEYFMTHLSLDPSAARHLHHTYYTQYGLALEGLVRHHQIDSLEYNAKVDAALPLDEILKPDESVRRLLEGIDKRKCKMWILTNAYIDHAKRCLELLGLKDLFEGITYCDYSAPRLVCKPQPEMFALAMSQSNTTHKSKCFLIDDSAGNVRGATEFGWGVTVHLLEEGEGNEGHMKTKDGRVAGTHVVKTLGELRDIPELRDVWKKEEPEV